MPAVTSCQRFYRTPKTFMHSIERGRKIIPIFVSVFINIVGLLTRKNINLQKQQPPPPTTIFLNKNPHPPPPPKKEIWY